MDASTSEKKHELLEIPQQTSLERRLLVDNPGPSTKPEISKPETSALLTQLQSFLPQMKQSTMDLLHQQDTHHLSRMEQHSDEEGPYIELDLACGIFDLKDDAAVKAAEQSLINNGVAVEKFDAGSDTSTSSDSDDDDDNSNSYSAEEQEGIQLTTERSDADVESDPLQFNGDDEGSNIPVVGGKRKLKGKRKNKRAGIHELS